jgi:hypothetical protein
VIPFEVVAGSTITINGVQNFDNWTKCLSVPICEAYSCALEDGWHNLANGLYDEHDWRTFSGGTPTSGTGPDFDHTTGNSTGKYLYIEPTLYCVNKMASVLTPCVDLTLAENPRLKLWYHAYGSDMGSFHVDLFSGSKVIMDIADPVEGNKGNIWQDLAVDLTPWAGKVVGLRFRAVSGCKEKGDFAIDDLSVTEVITSVSPLQTAGSKQVSMFPNPAHDELTISFTEPDGQSYSLEIIDMYGRVVFEKEIVAGIYNTPEKINISGLMNGIYLIKLKSDVLAIQRKLVVR